MKSVLVTGAEGFIGSHLVQRLIAKKIKVKAFVQYNSFNNWGWLEDLTSAEKKKIDIYLGDIRDINSVKKSLKNCDAVAHLAALIAIPYSYVSPDTYIDTNIKGTTNILQCCREMKVKKIIHTSTSEVYGTAKYIPIDETHPLQGQSPYAATKIGADQIALSFYRSFDLPIVILRPFNTFGPRQSARAIIPTIITQALKKNKIKLGNLNPTRDFNYIDDTVDAFIKCLFTKKNLSGEVINIGSNYEISIQKTAEEILKILKINKKDVLYNDKSRHRPKKSEVDRLWCNNKKAKKLINWKPKYSGINGFKKGLSKTINWFSKEDNLKKYKADIYNV